MSQLTFDGFVENSPAADAPAPYVRPDTWYKGRVLSHSSIVLYRTCPQKWKFKYIDKIPEKPRSFFSFGKSVHTALEYLFSRLPNASPSLDEVLAHYKEKWLRDGYESVPQEKWFYQEGDRILRGFYAKHHSDFKKVLEIEYKFTIDIEGVPVTGFIDRIDITPNGGLALLDYKTGKAFDKSRVRNEPQLTLYQIAAKGLFGKPVESVTLYHLNSLTPLTVPAHSQHMEDQLRSTIVDVAKGISEEKFPSIMNERGHCQWCDYMQICPAFAGRKWTGGAAAALSDSLPILVDRLGKLNERIGEMKNEKADIEQEISTHLKASGQTEAKGEHFKAELLADELRVNQRPASDEPK